MFVVKIPLFGILRVLAIGNGSGSGFIKLNIEYFICFIQNQIQFWTATSKVPTRDLSDREQKQLLYRRKLQFGTGDAVKDLIPSSEAAQRAEQKKRVTQALKDAQAKTPQGSLQQMMMNHFKETTNALSFYSLPIQVVRELPIKQMSVALTTMLAVKGKPAQPAGTLPVANEALSKPLEDRVKAIADKHLEFLEPLRNDVQDDDSQIPVREESELDLEQLIEFCQLDGLLVFKVAEKNPHLKKRPLHSVDNVIFSDVAIRLYKVNHNIGGDARELWVAPTSNTEVPLVQLFAGKDPQKLIDHMESWRLANGYDEVEGNFCLKPSQRTFVQRLACPLSLEAVDIAKHIKPSPFEMYLHLSNKGWVWKSWRGKATDLRQVPINISPTADTLVFYSGTFYYLLCLVTFPAIAAKFSTTTFLVHGQLEAYYAAAFQLAQEGRFDELEQLKSNQPASFYRTQ